MLKILLVSFFLIASTTINIISQPRRTASPSNISGLLLTDSNEQRIALAAATTAVDLYRQSHTAIQAPEELEAPQERRCITIRCCVITACFTLIGGIGLGYAAIHEVNKTTF